MAAPDVAHLTMWFLTDFVHRFMRGGKLDYRRLQSGDTQPLHEFLSSLARTDSRQWHSDVEPGCLLTGLL
jgi:hypothetical protein